jgi:hypothetical protein
MWRLDSDSNKECLNVQFYRNEIPMKPVGLTLAEFHSQHRGNFRFLESCHSFIQWLFPNRERGLNYQAPVLTKEEIATMSNDAAILDRVRASLQLMLEFYGMSLITLPSEDLAVCRHPRFWDKGIENLAWSSHNWLRISRILKFLTDIGLEREKMAFLRRLRFEVTVSKKLFDAHNSYARFWAGTIADEAARKEFLSYPGTKEEMGAEVGHMRDIDLAGAPLCAQPDSQGKADSLSSSSSSTPALRGQSTARSETEEGVLGADTDSVALVAEEQEGPAEATE